MTAPDSTLKVMHLISAEAAHTASSTALTGQLTALLSRMDRHLLSAEVVHFAKGSPSAAILRQLRIPVHELELSRKRFALSALRQLKTTVANFQPDIIHAWGHSAQLLSGYAQRKQQPVPMIWSMPLQAADTHHWLQRKKLNWLARRSAQVRHVIYSSTASAAVYRRLGFAEAPTKIITSVVDADRFKPDSKLGQQLRAQLKLEANAYVIGMHAPFSDEHDFHSFIRATAELIKYHPDVYVLMAGRGVQRGNSGLMSLLGGGTLATRTTLLGAWSDLSALFNACDVVCSCAKQASGAQSLAAAMLCGVPVVSSGKGLQGEVLGKFGIAIEPGSPNGLVRCITKLREMPAERRLHLVDAARAHVLRQFSIQGAVQQYLGLYLHTLHEQEAATAAEAIKLQRALSR